MAAPSTEKLRIRKAIEALERIVDLIIDKEDKSKVLNCISKLKAMYGKLK